MRFKVLVTVFAMNGAALAAERPLEIKGFSPGISTWPEIEASAKAAGMRIDCQWGDICFLVGMNSLAGEPIENFAFQFEGELLASVMITFNSKSADAIVLASTEKYGSARIIKKTKINGLGAEIPSATYEWNDGKRMLQVEPIGSKIDEGQVLLFDLAWLKASSAKSATERANDL